MKKENVVFVIANAGVFLLLMLCLFGARLFREKIRQAENREKKPATYTVVAVDWKSLYPDDTEKTAPAVETPSKLERIKEQLLKIGTTGERWIKDVYKYEEISTAGRAVSALLSDVTIFSDDFTRLPDGYWISPATSPQSTEAYEADMEEYRLLKEHLEAQGIPFLYCDVAPKECVEDAAKLRGITSYTHENMDRLYAVLSSYGIDHIDFRTKIHGEGLDHHGLYYKTDHHWTCQAGFWATSVIEQEIRERYGIDIQDVNSFGAYSVKTYHNAIFGAPGKQVTHFAEQAEDLDILLPEFETEFRIEIPDYSMDRTGSFEDVFIDEQGILNAMDEGGGYGYEQILFGNRPYVKITNLKDASGPRVLMIRNSFALVVAPYLAESCSELLLLDMRFFNGNVTACIDEFSPDIVLVMK